MHALLLERYLFFSRLGDVYVKYYIRADRKSLAYGFTFYQQGQKQDSMRGHRGFYFMPFFGAPIRSSLGYLFVSVSVLAYLRAKSFRLV